MSQLMNTNNYWQPFCVCVDKHHFYRFLDTFMYKLRDFLKHKTVKTNDKIRRFGVFMTPLSRKILKRSCKLQHFKWF